MGLTGGMTIEDMRTKAEASSASLVPDQGIPRPRRHYYQGSSPITGWAKVKCDDRRLARPLFFMVSSLTNSIESGRADVGMIGEMRDAENRASPSKPRLHRPPGVSYAAHQLGARERGGFPCKPLVFQSIPHAFFFQRLRLYLLSHKDASILQPVCLFLLHCPKEIVERKGHRCAELYRDRTFAPSLQIAKVCAKEVSAFSRCFGVRFGLIFPPPRIEDGV